MAGLAIFVIGALTLLWGAGVKVQVLELWCGAGALFFAAVLVLLALGESRPSDSAKSSPLSKAEMVLGTGVIGGAFAMLFVFGLQDGIPGLTTAGGIVGSWVGVILTYYFTRGQVQEAKAAGSAESGGQALQIKQNYERLLTSHKKLQTEVRAFAEAIGVTPPPSAATHGTSSLDDEGADQPS